MTSNRNVESAGSTSAAANLKPSATNRWSIWTIVIPIALAGGLVWGGIAVFSGALGADRADATRGALSYQVGRNPLQVTVVADGNLESASNIEVKCRVAGGGTILWIVEDGKVVEEGEEIVKLDTSAIDDKLNSQRIVYEKALATQIQAQEDLEAAKISVKEYEEGTYIGQLKQVESQVQIALENLRSSENQLQYTKKMVRKGFVSSLQREADEFAVERAKLDLDAAVTSKKVLVEFTKEKTLKDLVAKREAASARLRSEQAGLQLEKARLDRLQDQLKNCVITAPKKGMVVYANESSRGRSSFDRSSPQGAIEEGAMVRESQALVRLPDLTRMQVKVSIHETRVEQIKLGMPARVVVQEQEYTGKVLRIANQPSQGSWSSANVKEYATVVSIDGESTGLRPGMTAKVTILVAMLEDALTVPVSSVVEQRGGYFCWVKSALGPQRRPLKLGQTNDKFIEVVDGVKEGDEVLRNPRAIVEEAREEEVFEKQARDVKFAAAAAAAGDPAAASPAEPAKIEKTSEPAVAGVPAAATARLPGSNPGGESKGDEPRGESRGEGKSAGSGKRGGRGSMDLMQYDKDGDKKVSREEAPERMQGFFDRMDPNGDGFIDESEIADMRKRRPSGGGGGRGEGRPGGSGGDGSRGEEGSGGEGGADRQSGP